MTCCTVNRDKGNARNSAQMTWNFADCQACIKKQMQYANRKHKKVARNNFPMKCQHNDVSLLRR